MNAAGRPTPRAVQPHPKLLTRHAKVNTRMQKVATCPTRAKATWQRNTAIVYAV